MTSIATSVEAWGLVTAAGAMAARAHEGQVRHDGTPYVQHPARVAVLLAAAGADDALIAAGLLHDVIEDSTVDWDEIAEACSADVADWVAVMTKDMRIPEDEREALYKQQLIDGPWHGRAVKLADQFDNFTNAADDALAKVRPKALWALEIAANDSAPVIVALRLRLEAAMALRP